MRILMVSKFRAFQGGVETHLHDLISGLRSLGNEVELFSSEDVGGRSGFDANARSVTSKVHSVASLLWNSQARRALQQAISDFQPDVVHYHSIYHQLSPSVLGATAVPAVMTLHDYKLVAPCYSLYRDSDICTDCVGLKFPLPAIKNRCVKNSMLASAICAGEQLVYKGRYEQNVDQFIVPSGYLFNKLVSSGIPAGQMTVVPWGVPRESTAAAQRPADESTPYFLYAGRLHESKGFNQLLAAWESVQVKKDFRLVVAGAGAEGDRVRAAAVKDPSIQYLGVVDRSDLLELVSRASATVVPSIVPETMGLSALESMTAGTPVIATLRGALSDLSGEGVISVSAEALTRELRDVFSRCVAEPDFLAGKRVELAKRDMSIYSRDAMVTKIVAVYSSVLSSVRE